MTSDPLIPAELQSAEPRSSGGAAGQLAPPSSAYRSVFESWHQRASVRTLEQPAMGFSAEQLFFSPDFSTLFLHPLVLDAPEEMRRKLLISQFYVYMRFTVFLELGPVNEVCNLLRQPGFLPWIPRKMKEDAFFIYTDEGYHATFSGHLISEAEAFTGVRSIEVHPIFLDKLDDLVASEELEFHALVKLFFVIISETLITGTLAGVPKDPRVQDKIRAFVEQHRVDEGRHHKYFKDLFYFTWPRLPRQLQRKIGCLLPEMILAFLQPDARALTAILSSHPSLFQRPRQMVEELISDPRVMDGIQGAARHTTAMLTDAGAFEDPVVVTAFRQRGFSSAVGQ